MEFRARAVEFMADGIAAGQWIEYVCTGSADELREELAGLDGAGKLVDEGGLGVSSVGDFYALLGQDGVVDPTAAVDKRVSAAERALAQGYTGFRAVVDATGVVRTDQQRHAFSRFEHLIDQKMSVHPISALCAYDVSQLTRAAVAEMACLHPLASQGSVPFRLYADRAVDLMVDGEIDVSCTELFDTTLARVLPLSAARELIVDGRGLEFIDHRGLLALDHCAREHDRPVVLRTGSPTLARVASLLPLEALRVHNVAVPNPCN